LGYPRRIEDTAQGYIDDVEQKMTPTSSLLSLIRRIANLEGSVNEEQRKLIE
jgi:hypothetical protein